ncbi:hypothetical protein [Pseudactinotalea sp. Z1748]|uniref:hypothetical protein n=1 Tax=Pseudactinotalea sp. Z1748 TaxID=3413027 RepID=UPI003C7C8EB2
MDDNRRWKYLLEPGEGLLLSTPDPDTDDESGTPAIVKQAHRLAQWTAETGLAEADVISTPLVATPLPAYAGRIEAGQRRWDGLRPHVMWHPLMWMPQRLAEPYMIVEEDEERLETVDEWAIRVALEMTASGMYDPETGGWLDVMALHDIDIEAPGQVDRIEAWLQGAVDPELDAIDLDAYISSSDQPDWAVQVAAVIFADVIAGSWSITATDLIFIAEGMAEAGPTRTDIEEIIRMGSLWAGDAVIDLDLSLAQRLEQISDGLHTVGDDPQELREGPLAEVLDALTVVANAYAQALDNLDQMAATV